MFNDIVLNTNLHLEENLYMNHQSNFFNLKRDLRSNAWQKPTACDFYSDIDKTDTLGF